MKKNNLVCPTCGGNDVQSRGSEIFCKNKSCPKPWNMKSEQAKSTGNSDSISFSDNGNTATLSAFLHEPVRNLADAIRVCKVDTETWLVDRHEITVITPWRKDRQTDWHVEDQKVIKGRVKDTGKIVLKQAVNVKLFLIRKTQEIRVKQAYTEILNEIKKKSPKPKLIKYKTARGTKHLFEVALFDIHFGKQTLAEETGQDYGIEISRRDTLSSLSKLLEKTKHYNVERILLPWGNDFYNVDNAKGTTSAGTIQQEDQRWNKTFRLGRYLTEEVIAMCLQVAPVDVLIVPGNHDTERMFTLGECLVSKFDNHKFIKIDNGLDPRKYYHYGKSLLGFVHGKEENPNKLPSTMSIERPKIWGEVHTREWHLGHFHKEKLLQLVHNEELGCTVRYINSLSTTDLWHHNKQYIGARRIGNAFVWDKKDGFKGHLIEKP